MYGFIAMFAAHSSGSQGGAPAAALFATKARYKRESYRGSEFAPRILADNGIRVVMKVCISYQRPIHTSHSRQSDHPVLDSRFLLAEAQQSHYYGLPHNLALASITTTPAGALGLDHRVGYVKEGTYATTESAAFLVLMRPHRSRCW